MRRRRSRQRMKENAERNTKQSNPRERNIRSSSKSNDAELENKVKTKDDLELQNETELKDDSEPQEEAGLIKILEHHNEATAKTPTSPSNYQASASVSTQAKISTVEIYQYAYDQTEKAVKIIIDLPGIQNHPKEKISLEATELSFKFFVKDLNGKNWSLGVTQLAHEILKTEVKYILKKEKVVLVLPKSCPYTWTNLTPTEKTLKMEWTDIMHSNFRTIGINLSTEDYENTWIISEKLAINEKIDLLNPRGNHKHLFFFHIDHHWRTIEDVVAYAMNQITEDIRNGECNPNLLGVAVLQKLILRNQGKNDDQNIERPHDLRNNKTLFRKNEEAIIKSNKKVDDEVDFSFVPPDLSFKVQVSDSNSEKDKKSNSARLSECLEEKANNYFQQENYELAVETLTELAERFPNCSNTYSNRASCYLKLGRCQESLEDSKKAVNLAINNIEGWICIGESQLALGNPNECLEEIEKVLHCIANQTLSNVVMKLRNLSLNLEKAKKAFEENYFDISFELYKTALKTAVKNQAIKHRLIDCLVLSGKSFIDNDVTDIFIKEDATDSDSLFLKGMIYYYQDKKEEAFVNFDKCLDIDDGHERCKELYQKARDIYFRKERGNEYFKKGNYELAIESYFKAMNVDQSNGIIKSVLNFNIGVTHYKMGRVADAIQYISNAISLNDKYVKALLKRAEIYLEVNQIQDAVTDLEKVCEISPSSINTKLHEEAKVKLQTAPECQENFCSLEVEEQNKILAVSKKHKGNNFCRNGQYDEALELYLEVITLDPNSPIHYSNRSACHMMMKNYKEAMKDALKSLELDSSFAKGYLRKGRIELVLGKGKEALKTFNQGLKLDPKNSSLREEKTKAMKLLTSLSKGDECFQKKNFKEAFRFHSDAVDIASGCSDIMVKKLESSLYSQNVNKMKEIEVETTDPNYHYTLALLKYFECDFNDVLSYLNKAIEIDSNHTKAKLLKQKVQELILSDENARKAIKDLNYNKGRKILTQALKIDPDNKSVSHILLFNMGHCYKRQEMLHDAIKCFTLSISSLNDHVWAYIARANCYDKLGRLEEAVRDLEEVCRRVSTPFHMKQLHDAKLKLEKSKRKDYYKVLGLDPNATVDAIRKAYKTLAMEHHPDRHCSDRDEEKGEGKFKEINVAYNVLSDPLKRERYDRGESLDDTGNFFSGPDIFGFGNSFDPFTNILFRPDIFGSAYTFDPFAREPPDGRFF